MKKILTFIIVLFFSISSALADTQTLILFDASSSMFNVFYSHPLYYYAVYAVNELLKTYSNNDKIGLRIIGLARGDNITNILFNIDSMCTKTHLAIPIQTNTKEKIFETAKNTIPIGPATPLEYTLRQAINYDFSINNDLKHIILITDGGENCDGDPCGYIKRIRATRNDIKIDIIALSVDDEDFPLFNCLASETNGQFINILTPESIQPAINKITQNAVRSQNSSNVKANPTVSQQNKKMNFIYKNYVIEFRE